MLSASIAAITASWIAATAPGMPARKGDEVLVGLFDRAETLAQPRQRLVLERDHSSHRGDSTLAHG